MGLKSRLIEFYQRLVYGSGQRLLDHKREVAALNEIEGIVLEIDSTTLPVRRFRKKMLPMLTF